MIYLRDANLAFVHIPKNAGKSMRNAMMQCSTLCFEPIARDLQVSEEEALRLIEDPDGVEFKNLGRLKLGHLPLGIIQRHFPESWIVIGQARTFTLVRPPRDRFFSALLQYLREQHGVGAIRADDPLVNEEARRICDWLGGRGPFAEAKFVHFSRQIDYVELGGERIVDAVFPINRIDAAVRWIAAETGLWVDVTHDHARREPKRWARSIQPAARYVGRKLMPEPLKRVVYPFWMNSVAFDNASERYRSVRLHADIEGFLASYYSADLHLYEEACKAARAEPNLPEWSIHGSDGRAGRSEGRSR